MTELLLIMAVIFVAYVLYGGQKESKTATTSPIQAVHSDKPIPVVAIKPKTAQVISTIEKTQATRKTVVSKTTKPAITVKTKSATATQATSAVVQPTQRKQGLKDPKTGDIATSYNNYRFTKRWIKEALVAEGLLDKVYKNDELNADSEAKIKAAIAKLEALDKYRV